MTATADAERLLRAVLIDPADDLARLALADALEEEGDGERAEFIREQFANERRRAAGLPVPATANRELEIIATMPRFLGLPGHTIDDYGWNGSGASRVEYTSGTEAVFRRGLVESVRCTLAAWLAHGPAVCARQPVVRVEVTDVAPIYQIREARGLPSWRADFALIPGRPPPGAWFRTAAEAQAALSLACVNWAREASGLPPLPG